MVRVIIPRQDEKPWGIYHTGVCLNTIGEYCTIVEASLRELLSSKAISEKTKEWLRRFFTVTKLLVPDHVRLDNIIFYFVEKHDSWASGFTWIYVVFKHIEHFMVHDVQSWVVLMNILSEMMDTEWVYLQEANDNGEYLILRIDVDMDKNRFNRFIADAIYENIEVPKWFFAWGEK